MIAFGVKNPLHRAVYGEDFIFDSVDDIVKLLKDKFSDNEKKDQNRREKGSLPIKGSSKLHMICFHTDGSIQVKENICSCEDCIQGAFINCMSEKGRVVFSSVNSEGDSDEEDDEIEEESASNEDDENEICGESVMECLTKDSAIALYSHSSAFELFYVCKVVDFGIAKQELRDSSDHFIEEGQNYIQCQYYEKVEEKRQKVQYRLLSQLVYVHLAQVLSPYVAMNEDCSLHISDYQWLCDSI